MKTVPKSATENANPSNGKDSTLAKKQIVLVFQGGGALGAYQAGTYQALHEAGIEPDWIVGTSIGAINASLIAGNEPENRLPRLQEFWHRVAHKSFEGFAETLPRITQSMSYLNTILTGVPNFFAPNPLAFWGQHNRLGADHAGYYSTRQLKETLLELVDFNLINRCKPRLTVGAAHVCTSMMHYFDGRDTEIKVEHILASGALPPAFPAVRVDGELYWDGGILSNTPTEVVFEDNPRRNSVIFTVHMWNPRGPEPETIWEVLHRQKDVQYSSRVTSQISRQQQTHHLRHIVKRLASYIPETDRARVDIQELESWGCMTQMHVVKLLAPSLENEDHTKDVDFNPARILARWDAGYEDTRQAIAQAPWVGEFDPLEGIILHEPPSRSAAADRSTEADNMRRSENAGVAVSG